MDPHSRVAMKLRHRVLGKLVAALRRSSESSCRTQLTEPLVRLIDLHQQAMPPAGPASQAAFWGPFWLIFTYVTSVLVKKYRFSGRGRAGPEEAADIMIQAARQVELELYRGSGSKSEYQNRAVSRIAQLRCAPSSTIEKALGTGEEPGGRGSGGKVGCCGEAAAAAKEEEGERYVLHPQELVLLPQFANPWLTGSLIRAGAL
jgi:hypothetical protein